MLFEQSLSLSSAESVFSENKTKKKETSEFRIEKLKYFDITSLVANPWETTSTITIKYLQAFSLPHPNCTFIRRERQRIYIYNIDFYSELHIIHRVSPEAPQMSSLYLFITAFHIRIMPKSGNLLLSSFSDSKCDTHTHIVLLLPRNPFENYLPIHHIHKHIKPLIAVIFCVYCCSFIWFEWIAYWYHHHA